MRNVEVTLASQEAHSLPLTFMQSPPHFCYIVSMMSVILSALLAIL
jgi:hypothetical protein